MKKDFSFRIAIIICAQY